MNKNKKSGYDEIRNINDLDEDSDEDSDSDYEETDSESSDGSSEGNNSDDDSDNEINFDNDEYEEQEISDYENEFDL
jgi:hypothetical protein